MDTTIEIIAVLFNIAYVILAARKSIWCWPMGIIGSALSIVLFYNSGLIAESILFTYYVAMGVYGWVQWKNSSKSDKEIPIVQKPVNFHLLLLIIGYLGTGILFYLLQTYTAAEMPLLDSFTTVFSFIATWMVARRLLENWIYWIAIDALTVYLYISRGLEIYAALSLIYTFMAIYGYGVWRKQFQNQKI